MISSAMDEPLPPYDHQPCCVVTTTGNYLTINNTWSPDPAQAHISERWFMEKQAMSHKIPTVIIRAK
jgi:hypothetical protein